MCRLIVLIKKHLKLIVPWASVILFKKVIKLFPFILVSMSDAADSPDNVFDLYVLLKDETAPLDSSFTFSNVNLMNNIITGDLYIDNQLVEFEIDSFSIMYFDHFSVGDYLFNIIENKYIKRINYLENS